MSRSRVKTTLRTCHGLPPSQAESVSSRFESNIDGWLSAGVSIARIARTIAIQLAWERQRIPSNTTRIHRLFGGELRSIVGMSHRNDPDTSREAANLTNRQRGILVAYRCLENRGPINGFELGTLPEFSGFESDTGRKRASDLYKMGLAYKEGRNVNVAGRRCCMYQLTPPLPAT